MTGTVAQNELLRRLWIEHDRLERLIPALEHRVEEVERDLAGVRARIEMLATEMEAEG